MKCTGNAKNDSIVCAVCADDHFRAGDKSCLPCTAVAGDTAATLGPLIGVAFVVMCVLLLLRKKIQAYREKYGAVWRDALRILTINLSYAQINASLPSIINIEWPIEYLNFLKRMDFVEFDLTSVLGLGCVAGMDYRLRVSAAIAVPVIVALFSFLLHITAEISIYTTPHETAKARGKASEFLFDIVDAEEKGFLLLRQFKQLLQTMKHTAVLDDVRKSITGHNNAKEKNKEELKGMMVNLGAKVDRETGKLCLSRKAFLKAASHHEVGQMLGKHWIDRALVKRSDSTRGANVMFLLFTLHAPVSQRLFYYLDCHEIAGRYFLREDYTIECLQNTHLSFMPVVIIALSLFTFAFPLYILFQMCRYRKTLHDPAVRQQYGFLYARFKIGSEFWELHELTRKAVLTGILIFFPTTARAATAIFICVFCVMTLNLYQPHRNHIVFHVAQISFFLSTFKYLAAVVMKETGGMKITEKQLLGGLLISLDLLFMVGSFCSLAAVFLVLRRTMTKLQAEDKRRKTVVTPQNEVSSLSPSKSKKEKFQEQKEKFEERNNAIVQMFQRLDENSNGTLEKSEIIGAAVTDPELSKYVSPGRAMMLRKKIFEPMNLHEFKEFCNPSIKKSTSRLKGISKSISSEVIVEKIEHSWEHEHHLAEAHLHREQSKAHVHVQQRIQQRRESNSHSSGRGGRGGGRGGGKGGGRGGSGGRKVTETSEVSKDKE